MSPDWQVGRGGGKVDPTTISDLLVRVADADEHAIDEVFEVVHGELRQIAQAQLSRERSNHTLTPTALVNEAYVKLVQHTPGRVENRKHFLSIAARAMRQVLVTYAERRSTQKRGGQVDVVTFHDSSSGEGENARPEDVLSLDKALRELEDMDPRLAKIVECRFFAGLTQAEIASLLDISVPTVKRDWRIARAWLRNALGRK